MDFSQARISALLALAAVALSPLKLFAADACDTDERKYHPGHYVAPNVNSRQGNFAKLLVPGTQGIQKRYRWKDLEPVRDQYELGNIEADLANLSTLNGNLIALIEDKSFDGKKPAPEYMNDYILQNRNGGYTIKRWDPYVVERFNKLLVAIADRFDCTANFEGLAIQESALSLEDAVLAEHNYSAAAYRDSLIDVLTTARDNLPHSQVFWYMNFLTKKQSYLNEVADAIAGDGMVMGGPDILPDNRSLRKSTYPLYTAFNGRMKLFNSMQHDSYAHIKTTVPGDSVQYWTMEQLFEFARDTLHVNYIFWNHKTWRKPADSYDWSDAVPVIEANADFNRQTTAAPAIR